eukprot:Gb_23401 [translate_table: standard]
MWPRKMILGMLSSARFQELSRLSNGGLLSPITIFWFSPTIGRGEGLAICTRLKGVCFKSSFFSTGRCKGLMVCLKSALIFSWDLRVVLEGSLCCCFDGFSTTLSSHGCALSLLIGSLQLELAFYFDGSLYVFSYTNGFLLAPRGLLKNGGQISHYGWMPSRLSRVWLL